MPGAEVVLHWNPAHTFGLDAAQDIDAGVETVEEERRLMATVTEAPPLAPQPAETRARRASAAASSPYWLLLPGILWLLVFFALPMVYQASTSVQTGSLEDGFKVTWHFATYWDALADYWPQFLRSVLYAGAATILCLVLGYPLAYLIAFRAGRWRNLVLILVIAPFFTSFLIRTLAWKTILADSGPVVGTLNTLHILDVTSWLGITAGDRVLATPLAVVCGLTYNFLPFMILPLYTSLERIDGRLHEAAGDLYATPVHHLPQGDLPAVDARRRLRHAAHLHPGRR